MAEHEMEKGTEKETVAIRKLRNGMRYDEQDEVALEQSVEFPLKDGRMVRMTCTPTHIEEMVLGRRFLLGDLLEEELQLSAEAESLRQMSPEDIFRIEREIFERPGSLFRDTGCAHSCALVRNGAVVAVLEDIGRHNALDKIIGYALKNGIAIPGCAVFCSGRISEDYLQKAADAGFLLVVSRAAVTAGAVALAKKKNVTLLGFVRNGSGNLYHEGSVSVKSEK